MIPKNIILIGLIISMLLLLISALYYPGGSSHDPNAEGFSMAHNYLSNLFNARAVNGLDNPGKPWAIVGMLFLCATLGGFFIKFSQRIEQKSAANIIKFAGIGSMVFAFLTVTPLHDLMISLSTSLALIASFYIIVFILKSKFLFLKILSVVCLLVTYGCAYMYFTRSYLDFLPIMQKVCLLVNIAWIISLEYFYPLLNTKNT